MANELILIVEDNDKNLKLVRDVLQFKGYQTIEAGTGEEGVRLSKSRIPDLILMDIQLPGMDGITALGELRADPTTRAIPVMAVTAITGIARVVGSARSWPRASMPSMPGSWMSISTRAGCRSRASRTPSSPVPASIVW